jgi:recombination associated protein RdgC
MAGAARDCYTARPMSALKGSLTYARFFVEGDLPDDFRARFMRAIRLRVMQPLDPEQEASERCGWCAIGEAFDLELNHDKVFYNDYLNLGFRTDRWAIPAPLLHTRVPEAEAAYREKKGRERLSKRERTEIKELVARRLRKQSVPATRAVDLSWSLGDGVVRFFSQSARPTATMTELFAKTFALKLVPEAPYTLAARLGLSKAQEKLWETLEPTGFSSAREA